MEELTSTIAKNLKLIRQMRELSLDQVAELTGVSKSMLGQIERGSSSPTIQTMWKISNGLGINFTYLIQPMEQEITIVRSADKSPITGEDGHVRIYSEWQNQNQELISIEIDPLAKSESNPHIQGTQEHLVVHSGTLKLTLAGEEHLLYPGDSASYYADVGHIYENPSDTPNRFTMLISYTRRKDHE